jgi:hypothetical protein
MPVQGLFALAFDKACCSCPRIVIAHQALKGGAEISRRPVEILAAKVPAKAPGKVGSNLARNHRRQSGMDWCLNLLVDFATGQYCQ